MIENKIEMLSDKEHIKKRPGMYIGSVSFEPHERFLFGEYKNVEFVPGLIKLVDEIIDNSIDEAIRTNFKFANEISVFANQTTVKVSDNGRGIPQDDVVTPEGETIPGPVAAWTRTKAGGNFGADADRKTGGQNGVGSALTNIFSKSFTGTTCDGKNKIIVRCQNGSDDVSWNKLKSSQNGTKVEFSPDFSHFEVNELSKTDLLIINYRLMTLSVVYPKIKFSFNGVEIKDSFKNFCKQFDEESVVNDSDTCSLGICRSPDGFRHLSYVNGINTINGGSHVEYVLDELSTRLIAAFKKKHGLDVTKSRIKECLTIVLMIRDMSNLRFDSQTKERLSSPYGDIKKMVDFDFDKIAKSFLANEELVNPIIESALNRKLAAERAAATKANKKAQKTVVAKHIYPTQYGIPGSGTQLFLAEGDSAIGFLLKTRDKKKHGGMPLRGKVLTTWGRPPAKQMENKEIFEIVSILGLEYGRDVTSTSDYYLNYDFINIFCDNDYDGRGSIYPSLLSFFSQWPGLFKLGRVRWVKTPIIIASKDEDEYEDTKWFYSMEEYENAKKSLGKYSYIRYIKGLGSLVEEEYSRVVNDPQLETVVLNEGWEDKFNMLFEKGTGKSDIRKEWIQEGN